MLMSLRASWHRKPEDGVPEPCARILTDKVTEEFRRKSITWAKRLQLIVDVRRLAEQELLLEDLSVPRLVSRAPTPWWSAEHSRDLILGVAKHGFSYEPIFKDPELLFHQFSLEDIRRARDEQNAADASTTRRSTRTRAANVAVSTEVSAAAEKKELAAPLWPPARLLSSFMRQVVDVLHKQASKRARDAERDTRREAVLAEKEQRRKGWCVYVCVVTCVCVCVCLFVCLCVCVCVCLFVCLGALMCMYVYVYMYVSSSVFGAWLCCYFSVFFVFFFASLTCACWLCPLARTRWCV
jgi:hypothetical protein